MTTHACGLCAKCGVTLISGKCKRCYYQLYLADKLPLEALAPLFNHAPTCERDFDQHCTCGADRESYAAHVAGKGEL